MSHFSAFGLVFLGGGVGSMVRYGMFLLLRPWQVQFPWATLAANALACLLLGVLIGAQVHDSRRLLLATGFCGGFSTFSTFTAESLSLWQQGQVGEALTNVAGSLALCTVCLLLGLKIGS